MGLNTEMDGSLVEVGDLVHDVLYGSGEVVEILPDNRFRVKFQSKPYGLVFASNGVGVRYTRRTLFWHDPILAIPIKNQTLWNIVRPIVTAVVDSARAQLGGRL